MAHLWWLHYTISTEKVQCFLPDQSPDFVLEGLGARGRIVEIRPVKGIADLSADAECFVLHVLLSFRKCGNDIVSLMASIIVLFPFIFSMLWYRVGVVLQPLDQVILHDQLASADVQRGEILAAEQIVGSCPRDSQSRGDLRGIQDVRQIIENLIAHVAPFPHTKSSHGKRDCWYAYVVT